MTNTWTAKIAATTKEQIAVENASALLDRFADQGAAVSFDGHRLDLTLSLAAGDHWAACAEVLELLPDLQDCVGEFTVHALELLSPAAFVEAGQDRKRVAGLKEVADLLGVSTQRANQITSNRGFPEPVENLASGRLWQLEEVKQWASTWQRKIGRPAN